MRFFILVFLILFSFLSCKHSDTEIVDTSTIEVDFSTHRYEVDFYNTTKENLPDLKNKYPYFFPKAFTDSLAISKINNKDEQELFKETQKQYPTVSEFQTELTSLFKHITFYNPTFKSPDLVTFISNIDYNNRVIYADSLLLVSLDAYLGSDHNFYADFPIYIKQTNTKEHLIVDVADAIIEQQVPQSLERSFIGQMIHEGKKMYLLDRYLPTIPDTLKIGYTKSKFQWATENEENIWMYFIEKKILFSTDTKLKKRFLENAPFSKFYLHHDRQSPGRIGVWVGWQIVKSFMQNNDVSLQKLLTTDSEDIFNKSRYKPKQ